MKIKPTFLLFILTAVLSAELNAQFMNQNRFGRQRSSIPQGPTAPQKEPEKLTAEEYVEQEMPKFIETMGLDPFEEAVVRSILVKSVQRRMELQILNLEPKMMREEFEKSIKVQDEELKASLPPEKYQIYLEMRENPSKAKRKQKKKKKKDRDKSNE
ncbi:MAG: hypothetical protein AAGH81_09220 [Bacteroidota bacterium]